MCSPPDSPLNRNYVAYAADRYRQRVEDSVIVRTRYAGQRIPKSDIIARARDMCRGMPITIIICADRER